MKAQVLETLNNVTGHKLEFFNRGLGQFTFSFIGKDDAAFDKLKSFFDGQCKKLEADYDEELDETFIYLDVKI